MPNKVFEITYHIPKLQRGNNNTEQNINQFWWLDNNQKDY